MARSPLLPFLDAVEGHLIGVFVFGERLNFFYPLGEPSESVRPSCERFKEDLRALFAAQGFDGLQNRWRDLARDADLKPKRRLAHRIAEKTGNFLLKWSRVHTI